MRSLIQLAGEVVKAATSPLRASRLEAMTLAEVMVRAEAGDITVRELRSFLPLQERLVRIGIDAKQLR